MPATVSIWVIPTRLCYKFEGATEDLVKSFEAFLASKGIVPEVPGLFKDGSYFISLSSRYEDDIFLWAHLDVHRVRKPQAYVGFDSNEWYDYSHNRAKNEKLAHAFENEGSGQSDDARQTLSNTASEVAAVVAEANSHRNP